MARGGGGPPVTVVLTGASSGIGRASLQLLLERGAHVFGSVRKQADAERIAGEVAGLPGAFTPLLFDVTDEAGVRAAAAQVAAAQIGRTLTALVNNAGMNVGPDPLELLPLQKLRHQLEVNVVGVVAVTQAFLPLLGTDRSLAGPPGRAVFVGSIYGSYSLPWQGAYCATKHALEGLTESLRLELRLFGIPVVIIRPGPTASEIWDKSMRATTPGEAATGDWGAYEGSQYAGSLASTRAFVLKELDSSDFYLPCSAIAREVLQAVTAARPAPRVVRTSRYLEAWFLPRWVPLALRDSVIARKLGLARLPPLSNSSSSDGKADKAA